MFSFLDGISPVWWVAFGLLIGALEMLSSTTLLLWPALAALQVAALIALKPTLGGGVQLTVFAVSAIAFTIVGRWVFARIGETRSRKTRLNDPVSRTIGRSAEIVDCQDSEGTVLVDGVRWHARWMAVRRGEPGDLVRVCGAEGTTLLIEDVS